VPEPIEPLVVDCREVKCGLIPEMQRLLASTPAASVEFLLPVRLLSQVVSVLGTDPGFDLEITERGGEVSVCFRRRAQRSGPALGYL